MVYLSGFFRKFHLKIVSIKLRITLENTEEYSRQDNPLSEYNNVNRVFSSKEPTFFKVSGIERSQMILDSTNWT